MGQHMQTVLYTVYVYSILPSICIQYSIKYMYTVLIQYMYTVLYTVCVYSTLSSVCIQYSIQYMCTVLYTVYVYSTLSSTKHARQKHLTFNFMASRQNVYRRALQNDCC